MDVVARLKDFMESEARSCSMDFRYVTPLYVYRMWGGYLELLDECSAQLVVVLPNDLNR